MCPRLRRAGPSASAPRPLSDQPAIPYTARPRASARAARRMRSLDGNPAPLLVPFVSSRGHRPHASPSSLSTAFEDFETHRDRQTRQITSPKSSHRQCHVGRPLLDVSGRTDDRDQRLDQLRQGDGAAGYPRLEGACRACCRPGHHRQGRRSADPEGPRSGQGRNRGRRLRILDRARRHPHECREPARQADRPGGRSPAHRALAQRSGGAGFPPVRPRCRRCRRCGTRPS